MSSQDSRDAKVLVTAAGTIVAQGIMKCLRLASASKSRRVSYTIVATDMSPQAAGLYRGDRGIIVPPASSDDYVDSIIRVCRREQVSAVFCGSDEELSVLEAARGRLSDEAEAVLISNTSSVIRIGSDKWRTYRFLSEKGLPCAKSALPSDWENFIEEHGLPVVVKPRRGHGSLGFSVVEKKSEIPGALGRLKRAGASPMLQEYLAEDGEEFTAGVTSDPSEKVISTIAMRRSLKSGQTAKAFVEDFPLVRREAERVAIAMGSAGPLNVQSRMDGGKPKAFEINPRFSASVPIRAAAGVNEPDILYRSWVLGETLSVGRPKEIVALRYWNEVYVERRGYEATKRSGSVPAGLSSVPDYF